MFKFKYKLRNNLALFVTIAIVAYFILMDICLFGDLHSTNSQLILGKNLPIKKLMVGHASYYIRTPLAYFIEDYFNISKRFPWLTANVISFTHVMLSLISVKFLINDCLQWRQFGVILFQVFFFVRKKLNNIITPTRLVKMCLNVD